MKALVLAVVLLAPLAAMAADATHTIMQKDRQFHPGEITINRGDTLDFTNDDEFIHQIYVDSPSFSFDTDERAPGQYIDETFTQSGTFKVRCHIHPKMLLTVHVR